jgi:hypothetical protein
VTGRIRTDSGKTSVKVELLPQMETAELRLYLALLTADMGKRLTVVIRNKDLETITGCSRWTLRRARARLVELGIISVEDVEESTRGESYKYEIHSHSLAPAPSVPVPALETIPPTVAVMVSQEVLMATLNPVPTLEGRFARLRRERKPPAPEYAPTSKPIVPEFKPSSKKR